MIIKNISLEKLEYRIDYLIANATKYELHFMSKLEELNIKYKFQWAVETDISYFIADFYIPKYNLIYEIDGSHHYTEKGKLYDIKRDNFLKSKGYRVIHIPNSKVVDFDIMNSLKIKIKSKQPVLRKKKVRKYTLAQKAEDKKNLSTKAFKLKYPKCKK